MSKSKEKKSSKPSKSAKAVVQTKAYSEIIVDLVKEASVLLETAPKTLEVRGATKKLRIALNALVVAGKFAEVKE